MDALDIIIILVWIVIIYTGWRRSIAEQSIISVGIVVALLAAGSTYSRLVFLTEASGMRTVLLLLLVIAAGFLSYDLTRTLFRRLQKRFKKIKKRTDLLWWQRSISALIAFSVGFLVVWLAGSVLSNSSIVVIREQVNGSRIIMNVQSAFESPSVLKKIAHIVEPFAAPQAFAGAEPLFSLSGNSFTQQYTALDTATNQAKASVVKVSSWGCGTTAIGSGFLVSKSTIVTNAHVVAGATRIIIQDQVGSYSVQPIWFDPKLDVAILKTNGDLTESPLQVYNGAAKAGTIASIIGYPGGGNIKTSDAVVLQTLSATGYDIYGQTKATRDIYALRGSVVPGNSGGPLLDSSGTVIGIIFGNATSQNETGYALSTSQIAPIITEAQKQNKVVTNGTCAGV